jgi:hypothetical protein
MDFPPERHGTMARRYLDEYEDPYDDRDYESYPRYRRASPGKQSGLGIASFTIGLIVVVIDLLLFLAVGLMASGPGRPLRRPDELVVVIGLSFCAGAVAALVGLCLGFAALFQEHRNKVLAIIGVVLNLLVLLGVGTLYLIGVTSQRRFF